MSTHPPRSRKRACERCCLCALLSSTLRGVARMTPGLGGSLTVFMARYKTGSFSAGHSNWAIVQIGGQTKSRERVPARLIECSPSIIIMTTTNVTKFWAELGRCICIFQQLRRQATDLQVVQGLPPLPPLNTFQEIFYIPGIFSLYNYQHPNHRISS